MRDKAGVLFIGGTRYSRPLSNTQEKKIKALSEKLQMVVIGINNNRGFLHFDQHAEFHLVPSKIPNIFRQLFFLFYAFFKGFSIIKQKKIRLIVCQSPFEGISGVLLKKFARYLKLIVEIHGDWEKAPVAYEKLSPGFKWLGIWVGGWSLRNCDAIRVVSESMLETIKKYGKRIFVFPAYIDIELFLKTIKCEPTPHRFIFVGQIIKLKGIDTLIQAVEILKDKNVKVEVLLIGEGKDYNHYKNRVKKAKLESEIKLIGLKKPDEVAELIMTSNALILPSYSEGFPRVIIEAFACSRPVIASAVGGIPELVRDGENGFIIEPGNPEVLADKILNAWQNPDQMKLMGQIGKKIVWGMFGTKLYVEDYSTMIHVLLKD
jgi:glycosyltransferase involved in cell wall biosynthesis